MSFAKEATTMNTQPLLSIITINLNDAPGLERTLKSLENQKFRNYEHIIIDGGSKDHSVDVIMYYNKEYKGIKNGLYWVSEPDKGIFNAMNKGIQKSMGTYCLFLNSGDKLINNSTLEKIFNEKTIQDYDIIYCDSQTEKGILQYPDTLDIIFFTGGTISHQSTLIKREQFLKSGLYDEDLKIVSDWKFWIKAIIIDKCKYYHYKQPLSYFEYGGISSSARFQKTQMMERDLVLKEYFSLTQADFQLAIEKYSQVSFFENSKLIQLIKTIQTSKLYKKMRKIK